MRTKSLLLVALQLVVLVLLLATGPLLARTPAWLALEGAGVGLGLWAMVAMGRHLRATPEPAAGARLLQHGPYRWIRHPMYSATLLVAAALVANQASVLRVALVVALVLILVVKLRHEERLLRQHFPGYAGYQQRTKRLCPGLW